MSDTDSKDIELKESLVQSDSVAKKINNDSAILIDDNYLGVRKTSIEQEALMFDYNRRRATSCVEISPRMVEELRKENKSQEKADSLDNFLSKLTAKTNIDFTALNAKEKQPSMTSLQSITKLTVTPKMQSSPDLKPKKTEKFAQVKCEGYFPNSCGDYYSDIFYAFQKKFPSTLLYKLWNISREILVRNNSILGFLSFQINRRIEIQNQNSLLSY